MIDLGSKVKDRISGVAGIAVSRIEFINGCTQYGVQAKIMKDGKVPDTVYVDEKQLDVLEQKKVKVKKARTGGPSPYAPR